MSFSEEHKEQIAWLLQGDPSIRYQTLRYLTEAGDGDVRAEQKRILTEGWGRQLLDLQDEDGTWSHSLYSPKWISTFYTLLLLKRIGAPPSEEIRRGCRLLLDKGFYDKDGGINYWKSWKSGECCVTGMLLSMLCHFRMGHDGRWDRMVYYLFDMQMEDGGWNCEKPRGAHHSSFHTTISVLEGLGEFGKLFPGHPLSSEIGASRDRGIELLLQHRLYKSDTTGETVHPDMANISFPPRWHYDILRCLDYLQQFGIPCDERMNDALELLMRKRTSEGYWKLGKRYAGKTFFALEKGGLPSRWNTLRALRVLKYFREKDYLLPPMG